MFNVEDMMVVVIKEIFADHEKESGGGRDLRRADGRVACEIIVSCDILFSQHAPAFGGRRATPR